MSDISNKMKQTLPQIGWLLGFWLLGEALKAIFHWAIPGSIIGMILLTLALELKVVKLSQVESASDFLIRNMAFFFIPPGVGLMVNLQLITDNWLAITVATLASTILVLIVTGLVAQIGRHKNADIES